MACPAIITGDQFLLRALSHIDCQAQLLGSYGYQALGQPGSLASLVMTGLLTLFIALFGVKLLFGQSVSGRDIVLDVLKIGIVLTLAFSWPAFRTVVYDVTLKGPSEITSAIKGSSLPDTGSGFAQRLQAADNAMIRLMERGTGRQTGALIDEQAPGGTFQASMLEDESAFGWARLTYLAGIIGSLVLLRILAGLLLAIAPLAAGLLLFEPTRGLFAGWLKGLVLTLVGSLGVTVVLAVEVAMLEPWLVDALRVRSLGYATPAAPIELLALTLAFAIAQIAIIALLARITFHRGWINLPAWPDWSDRNWRDERIPALVSPPGDFPANRAERISNSVERLVEREQRSERERTHYRALGGSVSAGNEAGRHAAAQLRLGDSYRRTTLRKSSAGQSRDSRT